MLTYVLWLTALLVNVIKLGDGIESGFISGKHLHIRKVPGIYIEVVYHFQRLQPHKTHGHHT